MSAHKLALVLGIAMLSAGPVTAAVVEFDLSGAYNWDGYLSTPERNEALSYNPPGDWGLGSRQVKTVFGQNSSNWSYSNRNYAWQAQVGASYVGLPDDGAIAQGDWTYQLSTQADAEPVGGWGNPQVELGTSPNGVLPIPDNVIRIYAPHTSTADPATASISFSLAPADQGKYTSINMLMQGTSNREFTIYADYDDGQEAVWTGTIPGPEQALDPGTYPSHADLESALLTTRHWGNVGSPAYDSLRTANASMWHFTDGLALDPDRTLVGLTFHKTPQSYASGDFNFYAISGIPIPEPATMALLALGGLSLLKRRRR